MKKILSGLAAAFAVASLWPLGVMAADSAAAKAKKVEIVCESTGSRIRRDKAQDCAKATQPTTNYYKPDLERTGQTDMNKTLRQLDPRFQ